MSNKKNPPSASRWENNRQSTRFRLNTNCVYVYFTTISEGGEINGC